MNIIFFSRREGRARHFNLAHPFAVAAFAAVLVAILATAFSLGFKIGESKSAAARGRFVDRDPRRTAGRDQGTQGRAAAPRRRGGHAYRPDECPCHPSRRAGQAPHADGEHRQPRIRFREPAGRRRPGVGHRRRHAGARPQLAAERARTEDLLARRAAGGARKRAAVEEARRADPPRWPPGAAQATSPRISASARTRSTVTRRSTRASISRAPAGSDVIAVAAGVVTFAGEKAGYGTLVEVSHGNGLVTRYGHNRAWRSAWAAPLPAVTPWPSSAPRAARRVRTCTSKCSRTAGRSTR